MTAPQLPPLGSVACLLVGALIGLSSTASAASPSPVAAASPLHAFLEANCLDCHDDTTQRGEVRLDNLAVDFKRPEAFSLWVKVLDQLDSGQMPPKKKPRPVPAQVRAVTDWLRSNLHAASVGRQQADGRAFVRRLSRTEYENTVHDLLGIDTELSDRLPEDPATGNFDNSDEALNLSSVLMERYLEAADLALDAAIATEPQPETKSGTFRFRPEGGQAKSVPWNAVLNRDDAVVFLNTAPVVPKFRTTSEGNYRVRIRGYGFQTNGKPITFAVYATRQYQNTGDHLLGYFQAPPDVPGTIEFTAKIGGSLNLKFAPHGLTSSHLKDPPAYKGPGLALDSIEVEGPLVPEWPPASHRRIFGDAPLESLLKLRPELKQLRISSKRLTPITENPEVETERIVRAYLPRAFRRPVTPEEGRVYVGLALERLKSGGTFEEAVKVGLKAALCSPAFLLRTEKSGRLDDYALASRLSYFLWSSMPDEELFALASRGQLGQPATLRQQVERMLKSPKSRGFIENFTGQWLGLRQIGFTTPDRKLYPEFDPLLEYSMVEETHRFFEELLSGNFSASNIVHSDFAMLNERLARHYRIEGVTGLEMQKVPLPPDSHRGGVLTQGAVLKVTANGTNSSPVIRGNWVVRNILGREVPPPPKGTPAIEPDIRGAKTIREELEKHRAMESCAGCHAIMDPPGFALESFDVIGGWRENYRTLAGEGRKTAAGYRIGPKVDPSGEVPGGRTFADIDEFKKLLLADKVQIARNITEKLMVYATGHSLDFADRAAVHSVLKQVQPSDFGLRSIVHEVVQSPTFRSK